MKKNSVFIIFLFSFKIYSKEIQTNNLTFLNAPNWLSESRVEKVTNRIQNELEWDIRKIKVIAHHSKEDFNSAHQLNFEAHAFFSRKDSTIHIAPTVTENNFDSIFGHELVHAVFFQKYKNAIPAWIEEGLANYIGAKTQADYLWLSKQTLGEVTALTHPNQSSLGSHYHYQASTAVAEMIAKKCSLKDLLQLSVGKNMATYLSTYCEIKDINMAFKEWINIKSKNPKKDSILDENGKEIPWWKKKKKLN